MKRYVTLIECVAAFSLTALLFATLCSTYVYLERNNAKAQHERKNIEEWHYAHARLTSALSATTGKGSHCVNTKISNHFFYTPRSKKSLVFTYDNGLDIDPLFCKAVLGKLYLEKGALVLLRFPAPHGHVNTLPEAFQREALLENVKDISFSFYDSISPSHSWEKEWPINNKETIPDFIKIAVSFSDKRPDHTLTFHMKNGKSHKVSYKRKTS
jgi:hypothetical protein